MQVKGAPAPLEGNIAGSPLCSTTSILFILYWGLLSLYLSIYICIIYLTYLLSHYTNTPPYTTVCAPHLRASCASHTTPHLSQQSTPIHPPTIAGPHPQRDNTYIQRSACQYIHLLSAYKYTPDISIYLIAPTHPTCRHTLHHISTLYTILSISFPQ